MEHAIEKGWFVAPKVYLLELKGGSYIKKFKGISPALVNVNEVSDKLTLLPDTGVETLIAIVTSLSGCLLRAIVKESVPELSETVVFPPDSTVDSLVYMKY